MDRKTPGRFINYKSRNSRYNIPCDEINSLMRDRSGNIWVGSIGGGVLMVNTKPSLFAFHSLDLTKDEVPSTAVRALFSDSEKNLWMGIGSYGLARKDNATGELSFFSRIPEFSGISKIPTINTIIQRRNGELWFGTYDLSLIHISEPTRH